MFSYWHAKSTVKKKETHNRWGSGFKTQQIPKWVVFTVLSLQPMDNCSWWDSQRFTFVRKLLDIVASFGYYGWYYVYVRAESASVGSKEALKAKFFGVEECVLVGQYQFIHREVNRTIMCDGWSQREMKMIDVVVWFFMFKISVFVSRISNLRKNVFFILLK